MGRMEWFFDKFTEEKENGQLKDILKEFINK